MSAGLDLLIPDKPDPERDAVACAWQAAGGQVLRLGRFWDPPPLDPARVRLYGNDSFVHVLAQKLGLALISPADDLLVHAPQSWLKRALSIRQLADCATLAYPAFIKPVIPKAFRAAIYPDFSALSAECAGLADETPVYVSEIVTLLAEARAFVLEGAVCDLAGYEGAAPLEGARTLAAEVAHWAALPKTCVLDFGYTPDRGWLLIEANACWGAGLNGCRAERVLACIAAGTRLAG